MERWSLVYLWIYRLLKTTLFGATVYPRPKRRIPGTAHYSYFRDEVTMPRGEVIG